MVFEAIVVDILNKFLRQYIENLDTSQLKIGIWGGDVVLADLIIKQTIFKELNLPFKVAYGKLGKFTLKIPWKNLYGESTSAFIENLFILFVPNTEIEYDVQKEEKWLQEKKQEQLRLLDEAKKKERLKDKPETPDTFMEKLIMQIVKTIQIEIKNIHIRYEDKTTDPKSPFSIGATISNLSLKSTPNDPFPLEFQKTGNIVEYIYKMIQLEGLSVYWNTEADLLAKLHPSELQSILLNNIPKPNFKPPHYKFVFGPIVAKGSLRLNPKPESDGTNFATPKVLILVELEKIKLAVSRKQYKSISLFLRNLQRMNTASKYRKYKPFGVPVKGNAREWWRFAYEAVTEDIKRRRIEWTWHHIKGHREMCRKYEELFRIKITTKKMQKQQENELTDLEKRLNTFNLILLREKVYLEVERLSIAENETKQSSGWFSYFFSSGGSSKSEDQEDDLVTKLGKVMTPKEKEKLYKAIDYEENFNIANYPDYFVEFKFIFKLKALLLRVFDDKRKENQSLTALTVSLNDVNLLIEKRPSASAMKVAMNLGDFTVLGKVNPGEEVPELVKSNCKKNEQLMEVLFETNPLDKYCDQRVHVHANALNMIYHADTVNILRDIFHLDAEDEITTIVATAASLPTFREITSMGLQYAISKSSRLEVRVHLLASKMIIPYGGVYNPNKEFIILKLGQFDVTTEERTDRDMSVRKLYLQGSSEKDIFSIFLSASYRKFKCQLMGVQILYRLAGEDWNEVLESTEPSPLRLLEPTNLTIVIKKCLVTDDARIPKAVIEGILPSIAINISEERAICLAALISSIPTSLPESEPVGINRRTQLSSSNNEGRNIYRGAEVMYLFQKLLSSSAWSLQSLGTQLETKLRPRMHQKGKLIAPEDFVQGIDLVARFEMNKFVVTVSKKKSVEDHLPKQMKVSEERSVKPTAPDEEMFLEISVLSLNCEMTSKTFETLAELRLGAIEVKQNHNGTLLSIVETRGAEGEDEDSYLFLVEYVNVDKKIPDFFTKRGGVVTTLKLRFTTLNAQFHKEAVINNLSFLTLLQNRLAEVKVNQSIKVGEHLSKKMANILEDGVESTHLEKKIVSKGKKFRKKKQVLAIIDLLVEVNMDSLNLRITSDARDLSLLSVKGGKIELTSRKSHMIIDCKLSDILVLDLDERTMHQKIVSSVDHQTLSMKAIIFNQEYLESSKSVDISFEAEVGRVRLVFVNRFITTALDLMSSFQKATYVLKEGATAAAHKAKEGVLKAYENETKISLNIKVTAPLIVFPRKSTSFDVLLVDMGVLTVKSFIIELEDVGSLESGGVKSPLMDVIRCHLENVKVVRALLGGSHDYLKESSILDPMTLELTLHRNLSISWFKEMVPLEVEGTLDLVHVSLTHSDLCFIVHSLQENFAEGYVSQKSSEISCMNREDEKQRVATIHHKAEDPPSLDKTQPSIVFSFRADRFIFDNVNDYMFGNEVAESNLARFTLEVFVMKGTLFSNGSMSTSAFLSDVKIDDTRPGKGERITNLMRRNPDRPFSSGMIDTDSSDMAMLNLSYEKKDMDSFVDIRVYGFNLILSMDFISKLLLFFQIDDQVTASPPIQTHTKQTELRYSSSAARTVKLGSQPKREKKDDVETGQLPTFTVNIRLEKPDIIIVENIDSPVSDALVFNAELLMKYRCAGMRQVITGTLSDITLVSCYFKHMKRVHTTSEIIKPFTISMAGSTPEGQGLHVDICLTDINISINSKTVELISKCQKSLLADTNHEGSTEEAMDYSDLWNIKSFHEDDYWFLRTEEGVDALLTLHGRSSRRSSNKKTLEEICLLSIPSVVVTFEGMSGKSRMPLILFEMSLQGQILNWSSLLTIECLIKIQMQYFNKALSAWEPLIEPTEVIRDKKSFFVPWELDCSVVFGGDSETDASVLDEERVSSPNITATLSCAENLEITLTKSCLEVLHNLVDTFSSAVAQSQTKTETYPPYLVKNDTGVMVELLLHESNLQVYGTDRNETYRVIKLESGGEVELKEDKKTLKSSINVKKVFIEDKKELYLHVKASIFGDGVLELPISRTAKRYYPLKNPPGSRENWGLICDVNISQNTDVITLRSSLQIKNGFQEAIHVHYPTSRGKDLEYIGTVEGSSVLNLPFRSVYNPIKELYFKVEGFSVSTTPLSWKNIKNEINTSELLRCNPNNVEDTDPFFIMAIGEVENIYFENTYRHTISSLGINIHLQPTAQLVNCLPVDLVVCSQGCSKEKWLSSGEKLQVTHAEPGVSAITLRIHDYLEKEWSCKETLPAQPSQFSVWTFTSYNGLAPEVLNVGVLHSVKRSSSVFTIYCPYLMVNNTGQLLSYRFDDNSSIVFHPATLRKPLMFSPGVKKFFSKKKALMKVNQGDWSDRFPIDVAGSGGTIECNDPHSDTRYMIAITITLTFNSLSKIVLLSPYFVLLNKTNYYIECQEHQVEQPWLTIPPGSCSPFWPVSEEKQKKIRLRMKDTKEITPPFYYDSTDSILLKLDNKYGGLFVDIQTTNAGNNIIITSYEPGLAPALILNHTHDILLFQEKGATNRISLKPHQMFLYAWAIPTEERKLIFFDEKHKEYLFTLKEDADGTAPMGRRTIRYVSFLDGFQRILLFTEDADVRSDNILAGQLENSGLEVILNVHGIGVSLVNNLSQIEILYMGFVSSGISWETKKENRSRYKRMNTKDSYSVENAFKKYEESVSIGGITDSIVVIDNKMQINFETMEMLYPNKRMVRRVFEPGLRTVYRMTGNYITLHLKINKIQIDNQLHDSIFPVVLCPVPPPKTVAISHDGPKPFFELSMLKVSASHSQVQQVKYFKILVQEFSVKIDIGFINQCWAFITADESSDEENKMKFKKDLAFCEQPLLAHVTVSSTSEQKHFYDLLHFSPLKIHFSFSLAGNIETTSMPPALSVLLQSLGVTLTDFHDVLFRLSYFERKAAFLSHGQLVNEFVRHYYGQAVRQAYVLVLGLDVIGNPFGLVIGIGQGVEAFFYEPVQGIIQGPSDFATGFALGCRSLFGHAVGGTAGTLGRITGTLGKGLAVLSLDKEYQRERMEQQHKRTENFSTSMAQGGKGVVMGVYEGVTGVVMKPISGAKEEGVGGFFKGVGKGMMGLVTRPVTGVVDFASTSLNAVKRATELSSECKRLRSPRFFQDDKLVTPYKKHEAYGNSILYDLEKRKYIKTDKYEYHAELRGKEILLLTDKRLLLTEFSEVFGNWQVHLDLTWLDMASPPQEHAKGVAIHIPRKKGNIFQNHKDVKVLAVDDVQMKEMLCKKMEELYFLETRSGT